MARMPTVYGEPESNPGAFERAMAEMMQRFHAVRTIDLIQNGPFEGCEQPKPDNKNFGSTPALT